MRFDVVTLFPEMVSDMLQHGVTGRGIKQGLLSVHLWNPRDHAHDVHNTVDARPYGGGPGMVMKPEPLAASIADAKQANPTAKVVYLSPQGKQFDQQRACEEVSPTVEQHKGLILLCGRYEGVDERLITTLVDEEWSIGDFVLSGGEFGAAIVIDVIARLIPGVLGKMGSAEEDSFMDGLLDCPHYTRPDVYAGIAVPDVLQSGNHGKIKTWRLKQSLGRTWLRRPDLLETRTLSAEEELLLAEFKHEHANR